MCTFFLEKQEETRAVESTSQYKIRIFFFVELALGWLLFFGRGGNTVFGCFLLSQSWEMQFLSVFDFPKVGKRSF